MLTINLSGKLALVTGGSGDLGRAIVQALAACGADVAIHYQQNQAKADDLVAAITKRGQRAVAVQADVGQPESVAAMGAAIRQALGDPDIVVTNAVAQIHPWSTVLEESIEDYESQFRSSVMQNVLCAKTFVPAMRARGWGRIIGINTECTMQCRPRQSAYVAGKGGMDRVLRVLAREVGEFGITVNQVAPGWTMSDRYRQDGKEVDPDVHYTQALPLRRRGRDEDIAHAVCFLASDLACAITGLYMPVSSGSVMPGI